MKDLVSIASNFSLEGTVTSVSPLGNGLINDTYKVSGDDLIKLNGRPVLPLGTLAVTETKAPEGHVILQKETYFTLGKDGKVTILDHSLPYAKSLGYGLCIVNPAGEELPAAGGSGRLPFRAAGGGITALAAVLFVRGRRRKRGKKRNGEKNGVKMLKNCKHA